MSFHLAILLTSFLIGQSSQTPPLHKALQDRKWDAAANLIEDGADVTKPDQFGQSALLFAARGAPVEIVAAILDGGAPVDVPDKYGVTPLGHACAFHSPQHDVIQLLIDRGAKVNNPQKPSASPLYSATAAGNLDVARILIANGADVNIVHGKESALCVALRNRDPQLAAMFLDHRAKLDRCNQPVANIAAAKGHAQLLIELIDRGAEIDAREEPALRSAAMFGQLACMNVLLSKNVSVNATDHLGKTSLHVACENGQRDAALRLIEYGSAISALDISSRTPLHFAAQTGLVEVVKTILAGGGDVNALSSRKYTPLHFAAWGGHDASRRSASKMTATVQMLIANGAEVNAQGWDNVTPLHEATRALWPETVELLLANKANAGATDKNGDQPIHYLAAKYVSRKAEKESARRILDLLMQFGTDLASRNNDGKTPLQCVQTQYGRGKFMRELLQQPTDGTRSTSAKGG